MRICFLLVWRKVWSLDLRRFLWRIMGIIWKINSFSFRLCRLNGLIGLDWKGFILGIIILLWLVNLWLVLSFCLIEESLVRCGLKEIR